jgi:C4-dicarboxylate-specific signal transduction histidine kinase
MANSTETAMPSYALTDLLLALMQHSPEGAAIAVDAGQTSEARNKIEGFLTKVQRISATGTFAWRPATEEITASRQVYDIFDLDPTLPLTLELVATRVHPEDTALFHEKVEQARSAVSDVDFEPRLRTPEGSVKYLHVVAHGIRDQADQLKYIGAVHDVTSSHLPAIGEARAALTHVARLTTLGILTPSIARAVTQPLAGVMINASTCLRTLTSDPPRLDRARAAAQRTLRDAERAHDLVKRLRALIAKQDVTSEALDLNDVVREALALLSSELQKRWVVPLTEYAGDLPRVRGDRVQLRQVVLDLLASFSEVMSDIEDRPRHLRVRTELQDGAQVCVSVRDAGVIHDPSDKQRPFEASHTTESTGMTSVVSRIIVDRHHGRLWTTPNNGSGATLSFSIPAEASA